MNRNLISPTFSCLLIGFCAGIALIEGYHRFKADQVYKKSVNAELADSRAEVPIEAVRSNRRMVALAFGQSGASNSGETRKKSNEQVFNFYNGGLYRAEDPLLGATGKGGSVWTRLGDQLVERKLFDTVIFSPIGVNASIIARWAPGGDLHEKLLQSIRELQDSGLTITHLLWHQGESDVSHNTSKEAYQEMFHAMLASIRREGVTAPIYVSRNTFAQCGKGAPDPAIREAQEQLVDISNGIFPGPDTDGLGLAYRFDGSHFSDEGLQLVSRLWVEALTETAVALRQ